MPSLAAIMTAVAGQLTASIEASRVAFEHNLTKGEAVEAAVRKFFRDHLPDSIGVAHGQVIDRNGNISKQLDVILYDARRTPILFSDEANENRIIPVEGVIAVVESKTAVRAGDVPSLAESARVLKSLDRSAYYFKEDSVVRSFVRGYGKEWKVLPPLYFVLAFDGPSPGVLRQAIDQENANKPLHQRIDMACIIRKGMIFNSDAFGASIEAISSPGSVLKSYETENALLLFYILASRFLLQVDLPPISIQSYISNEFVF